MEKVEATGTRKEDIVANVGKPSFMVVDMYKALGMMVQLLHRGPNDYDTILRVAADWDGKMELLGKLG